jgi:hypothetical protein
MIMDFKAVVNLEYTPVNIEFVLNKNTVSYDIIDKFYYTFDYYSYFPSIESKLENRLNEWLTWSISQVDELIEIPKMVEETDTEIIVKMKYTTIRYNKADYIISIEGKGAIMSMGRIDLDKYFNTIPDNIGTSFEYLETIDKIVEATTLFQKVEFMLKDAGILYELKSEGTYCIKPTKLKGANSK